MLVSMIMMASSQMGVGLYFFRIPRSADGCTTKQAANETSPNVSFDHYTWTPLPLLLVFTTAFNIGVGSLSSPVFTEMLPLQSRTWTLTIANVASNISWFLVTKSFRTLQMNFGACSPFFLYGSACLVGFVFIFLFLPEPRDQKSRMVENEFPHLHQIRPGECFENDEL